MSAATLDYPVASPPPIGGALDLGCGVRWLRLPVPGGLRHINVWLLADADGWTLVDTGMDVPASREAWEGPLDAALAARPIRRIYCTHHHPDHAGLAAWLAARHGAVVYLGAAEERLMRLLLDTAENPSAQAARLAAFARDGLVATDEMRPFLAVRGYRSVMSGIPPEIRRYGDGDEFIAGGVRWVARLARGHTDGQLLLHAPEAGLLIAGDQVLPRITSNIGIYPERLDQDPLASFLGSFAALEAIWPEPLVLPSHGDVFRGLRLRLAQLRAHHAATLETLAGIVTRPMTAAEVVPRLFRRELDPLNRMLALGETLAHLQYLAGRGRLSVTEPSGEPRRYGPCTGV